MSRRELADLVSRHLDRPVDDKYVGKLERGEYRWPNEDHRRAFRKALGVRDDAELGFYIIRSQPTSAETTAVLGGLAGERRTPAAKPDPETGWGGHPVGCRSAAGNGTGTPCAELTDDAALSIPATHQSDGERDMRRRAFVAGLGSIAGLAVVAGGPPLSLADASFSRLLDAMLPNGRNADGSMALSYQGLCNRVAAAKTGYQACRYQRVFSILPDLLDSLSLAESASTAEQLPGIHALTADAYHVVGSVLLKFGEHPMAMVAAERSVRFAQAVGDPIAAGSSARIMTHALMSNGHIARAVTLAENAADELDRATRLASTDAIAVYGALTLRGAVSAARSEHRQAAHTLLDEAAKAATTLGRDGNDHWTGFGPTNVLLHRVNVSLALGDAGTAISYARQVDLDKVELAERKACLFVDVAHAYTQWGRHEQALMALRTAATIAPEEVRTRPTVRRIVSDLAALANSRTRKQIADFATTAGIRL